jgi:hypothetical protein
VAERTGEKTFADSGHARDILPKNMCLRLSSTIRIILLLESALSGIGGSFTAGAFTW